MVMLQWLKTQIMNYLNTGTVDKTPWLIGSMSRWMCNIYSDLNTSQDVTYYKHLKIVYLYPRYMYLKSVNSDQSRMRSFQPETSYSYQVKNN